VSGSLIPFLRHMVLFGQHTIADLQLQIFDCPLNYEPIRDQKEPQIFADERRSELRYCETLDDLSPIWVLICVYLRKSVAHAVSCNRFYRAGRCTGYYLRLSCHRKRNR
jgi:hypothetical protein